MMKNAPYFSHDLHSRNDPKIIAMQMKLGMEGVGIYWCLVEMLHEQGGYLPACDIDRISFELRTKYERITSVLNEFDLFEFDGEKYWSESALERIRLRSEKSDKAKKSIASRWQKPGNSHENANSIRMYNERNTNVLRAKYECNTIKEKKVKEIKGNKEKESLKEKETPADVSADKTQLIPDLDFSSSKPSKPKKSKPIPMPADVSISERVETWSREQGYTYLPEYLDVLRKWVENAKNRGVEKKYIDWDKVLMNCIRDDWGQVKAKMANKPRLKLYQSDVLEDWKAVY